RKEMVAYPTGHIQLPSVFPVGAGPIFVSVLDGTPLEIFGELKGELHGVRVPGEGQVDEPGVFRYDAFEVSRIVRQQDGKSVLRDAPDGFVQVTPRGERPYAPIFDSGQVQCIAVLGEGDRFVVQYPEA